MRESLGSSAPPHDCLGAKSAHPQSDNSVYHRLLGLQRKSLTARVGLALGESQAFPAIRHNCNVSYCAGKLTSVGEPHPLPQANNKTSTYFIYEIHRRLQTMPSVAVPRQTLCYYYSLGKTGGASHFNRVSIMYGVADEENSERDVRGTWKARCRNRRFG